MNSTGKKMRKQKGLNRYELHKASHAHKSTAKRRKMGWQKKAKH